MKRFSLPTYPVLAAIALALIVGAAVGYFLHTGSPSDTTAPGEHGKRVLYWHDPMVPGYRSDKPGKSPFMDMQLVPVYEGQETAGAIQIRPEVSASLGIRIHRATRRILRPQINAEGYLLRDAQGARAIVDLFDPEAHWVRPGLTANVQLANQPGTWPAVVERVQPDIDAGWRGLRVWLRIGTDDRRLRAHLPVTVAILGPPRANVIAIPREALIRTGERNAVVLQHGQGEFRTVEVVPGQVVGDWVEISRGVREGDNVVTSGQFLIDSETNIRAGFERLQAPPAAPTPTPVPQETKP